MTMSNQTVKPLQIDRYKGEMSPLAINMASCFFHARNERKLKRGHPVADAWINGRFYSDLVVARNLPASWEKIYDNRTNSTFIGLYADVRLHLVSNLCSYFKFIEDHEVLPLCEKPQRFTRHYDPMKQGWWFSDGRRRTFIDDCDVSLDFNYKGFQDASDEYLFNLIADRNGLMPMANGGLCELPTPKSSGTEQAISNVLKYDRDRIRRMGLNEEETQQLVARFKSKYPGIKDLTTRPKLVTHEEVEADLTRALSDKPSLFQMINAVPTVLWRMMRGKH